MKPAGDVEHETKTEPIAYRCGSGLQDWFWLDDLVSVVVQRSQFHGQLCSPSPGVHYVRGYLRFNGVIPTRSKSFEGHVAGKHKPYQHVILIPEKCFKYVCI